MSIGRYFHPAFFPASSDIRNVKAIENLKFIRDYCMRDGAFARAATGPAEVHASRRRTICGRRLRLGCLQQSATRFDFLQTWY